MGPALRILRNEALSVTLSGLADGETALLQKLLVMSGRPDRPAFDIPSPGVFRMHGTPAQLRLCHDRLACHPQAPSRLCSLFASRLDNHLRSDYKIVCGGRVLDLGLRTHVMGVLNVTPDSFSDGGDFADAKSAVARGRELAAAGADIIDVGGESTRPGAEPLPEEDELRRIIPVIERLAREVAVPISVDTCKPAVAERALKAGASIVNDITGLRSSSDMAKVVADKGAALILMHMQGTPRNMQRNPVYADVVGDILDLLDESIGLALTGGVDREKLLVDPGIGFGKTAEHNLEILDRLDEFRALGRPIAIGTSRKRFIGTVLGVAEPKDRTFGTAATVALAVERGARVVRVHDVAEMVQVARMTDAIIKASTNSQAPNTK